MVKCKNVDDRLKFAMDMIEKDIIHFSQFNYLYPFTTENINGYLNYFDLKDKSLLTVGSSSDQVLNAILCGCKDISLYDISPFIKEYYYLKRAAINTLNREEYLKFFCYRNYPFIFLKNNKTFDKYTFDKINEYLLVLDNEVSYYWSELFKKYKGKVIRKKLFNPDEYSIRVNQKMNRYLMNDDMYNILKSNIESINIDIICDDIYSVNLNRQYDNIFLSNILAYYDIHKYIIFFYKIKEYLNDNGKMLVSYLYDTDTDNICIDDINSRYTKEDIINAINEKVDFITFKGNNGISVNDNSMTDSIITYTKVKKI